ncbi:hypothetical protein C8J56DRAFT_1038959 [Mycena floridula]|nr:hypothetical protein C8J56DRAFT_1038959 [Mycena floridula]
MTAKDEPSCPVLTGATNHQIWKLRIRNKLRRAEVWQLVIGSLPNPAIPVTVTDTNGNTTTTMLTTVVFRPQEMFDFINKTYEETNVSLNAFHTFTDMLSIKYEGLGSIEDHVAGVEACQKKLVRLPDDQKWDTFRTTTLGNVSALASKSSTSGSLYCKHHGNCLHSTEDCQVLNRESESRDRYRSEHKHGRSSRNSREKGSKRDKKHSARHAESSAEESSSSESGTESSSSVDVPKSKKSKERSSKSSSHRLVTPFKPWFITYQKLRKPIPVYLGDEYAINAIGIGTVCFARDGDRRKLVLTKVLHVPDLSITLISVPRLTSEGF